YSRQPTQALATVERQLKLTSDSPRALLNKGGTLMELKRSDEAVAVFDQLLARMPAHTPALLNRGAAHLELGHLDAAERDYLAAAAASPLLARPHYGLADVALKRGKPAEAIAQYELALKLLAPGSPEETVVRQKIAALRAGAK
ncbi:MAG: tetratricopeptide repeat protein, partial [Verrucomicrobia bacterium]|nr:tetratricopeptide repeat protein [Verrucomicrobiota bacterium]